MQEEPKVWCNEFCQWYELPWSSRKWGGCELIPGLFEWDEWEWREEIWGGIYD